MNAEIQPFDYLRSLREIEEEIQDALHRVLHSGRLILGPETEAFEREFASFLDVDHAVGVTSGTTALHLALAALEVGPGDEVITVSNTCVPTVAAIRLTGATPVFVDVSDEDLMMDVDQVATRISARTRCIIPVHLWGMAVDLDRLGEVAQRHGVDVVEDCAQAHGTAWRGDNVGTVGRMGCFSFYPTKNIGSFGDAGAVVTGDPQLASRLRRLRMYGYEGSPVAQEEGTNGRISEMQAAVLRVKLRVYPEWLDRRLQVAQTYDQEIRHPQVRLPHVPSACRPTFHQYVIRTPHRDRLVRSLSDEGIGSGIHYPTPVHRMPAYRHLVGADPKLPVTERACHEILSLPIHEGLTPQEARRVAEVVNRFDAVEE